MIQEESRRQFLRELGLTSPVSIEIGVFEGGFSQSILDELKPKKLYLVDPWEKDNSLTYDSGLATAYSSDLEYEIVRNKMIGYIKQGKVVMIQDYSYNAVLRFPDQFFDFLYLDGCHLYSCVKQDLEDYLPKLKSGAVLAGHDYTKDFEGVIRAVDEFIIEHNFKMIAFNPDGGDWALKQME